VQLTRLPSKAYGLGGDYDLTCAAMRAPCVLHEKPSSLPNLREFVSGGRPDKSGALLQD